MPAGVLPDTFVEGWHDPEVVKKMPYNKFGRSQRLVSKLSIGASSFGNVYGTVSSEEGLYDVLEHAIKSGVNLVDTAPWYGHGVSESVLGRAIKAKNIPRKAFYLTTKVGRYYPGALERFDFTYERTLQSVNESLERMQVDYIDVVQVHDPEFAPSLDLIISETLPALAQLRSEGKIRHIGITGYPLSTITYLAEQAAEKFQIESCLSYCRYNLHDDTLVTEGTVKRLTELGVGVVNGSPYSMGLLIQRGPPAWHPAKKALKARCAAASKKAADMGFDIAHLAMAFCYACEEIPTTMTSTTSVARLQGDIDMVTGAHDVGAAGMEAIRAIREEFFSGPEFQEEQLNHWEGEEVTAYWSKVGKTLMTQWYAAQSSKAGRAVVPSNALEGPQGITAAHAVHEPTLYKA